MRNIFVFIILIFTGFSCSEYQKVLKSSDYDLKFRKAMEYYDKKDYNRTMALLDELMTVYRGTDRAEEINYKYAYCNYYEEDYIMAGYYFDNFIKTFPLSSHLEECTFLLANCYYMESPRYNLDQQNTLKAIQAFQLFINRFPQSNKVAEANTIMDELRLKLETKAYYNAKLYYNLGEYLAAVICFKNLLNEFPDTRYREELTYLTIKSHYLYAENSVPAKRQERFQEVISEYYVLADQYPQSKYLKEAERFYNRAVEIIKKQ